MFPSNFLTRVRKFSLSLCLSVSLLNFVRTWTIKMFSFISKEMWNFYYKKNCVKSKDVSRMQKILLIMCFFEYLLCLPFEIFSERATYQIKGNRIYTAICKCQAKADDAKKMPKRIVIPLSCWMNVKPQHKNVLWKKANCKNHHKSHHHFSHLFSCLNLFYLERNCQK